jgi:hypothetical protein
MEKRNPLLETRSSRLEILGRNFIDAYCNVCLCEVERLVHATSQPNAAEGPLLGGNEIKVVIN